MFHLSSREIAQAIAQQYMDSFLAKLGFIIPEKAFSSTFHAHHDSDVIMSKITVENLENGHGVGTYRTLEYTDLNITVLASMIQKESEFPAGKLYVKVLYGETNGTDHEVCVEEEFDIVNDPAYAHYD